MKKLVTLSLFYLASVALFAQVCDPNDVYSDTTGVFPPPYDAMVTPDGGIPDTACIDSYFEFVFTVAVGETLEIVPGFPQSLDSVVVKSVDGMPEGLELVCNPDNCTYPSNFFGCAVIRGTATSANAPGDYDLTIITDVYLGGAADPIEITFPNPLIAPGLYTLTLEAAGSGNCATGTNDILKGQVSLKSTPNPSNGLTQIQINSVTTDNFQFRIMDLLGNEIRSESIRINEGENTIDFDGTHLPAGIYVYSLSNEFGTVSEKMIIDKR